MIKTPAPVTIPPIDVTELTMSDLVLGYEGNGITWPSGTQPVPLNPYSEWSTDASMSLYAQLSGLHVDEAYRVTVDVRTLDEKRKDDAKGSVTVTFTETARAPRAEWMKSLSMRDLKPGRYRVSVTVTQGEKSLTRSEEMVVVEKR